MKNAKINVIVMAAMAAISIIVSGCSASKVDTGGKLPAGIKTAAPGSAPINVAAGFNNVDARKAKQAAMAGN
jgi:hypothetical protein